MAVRSGSELQSDMEAVEVALGLVVVNARESVGVVGADGVGRLARSLEKQLEDGQGGWAGFRAVRFEGPKRPRSKPAPKAKKSKATRSSSQARGSGKRGAKRK